MEQSQRRSRKLQRTHLLRECPLCHFKLIGPQHCQWCLVGTAGKWFPNHEVILKQTLNLYCLLWSLLIYLHCDSVFTPADGVHLPPLMTRGFGEKEAGGDHSWMRAISAWLTQPSCSITITGASLCVIINCTVQFTHCVPCPSDGKGASRMFSQAGSKQLEGRSMFKVATLSLFKGRLLDIDSRLSVEQTQNQCRAWKQVS